MSFYYYFQSPYLLREMKLSIAEPERFLAIRKFETEKLGKSSEKSTTLQLFRLKRGDSSCSIYLDECGRISLSAEVRRALKFRPIFILWSDGAKRTFPTKFFDSIYSNEEKQYFITNLIGSTALISRILDDKTEFHRLIEANGRNFTPPAIKINRNDVKPIYARNLEKNNKKKK